MRIYIDADGCPVVGLTIDIAKDYEIPITIVADYAHVFYEEENVQVILCDQGKDNADFEIINRIVKHDIAITQDYGLAALLLAKDVYVLSQNGNRYLNENMDTLLQQRHTSAKQRKLNKHGPHMRKRTNADDDAFEDALRALLEELLHE